MADETKTIAWQLVVETKGIEQNTKQAAGALDSLKNIAEHARVVFAAMIASEAIGKIVELSDAYTEFQNKLKLVTDNQTALENISQHVAETAAANASSITATAEMYNNFADALKNSGASAHDVMNVVDLVEKTVKLSGMTAEQAAGSIQHFALAMQSGSLSAKDVTALLRQVPELGKEIAAGLGVSIDKMKSLAADGKLTTQVVLDALAKSAPEIQAKFAGLSPTFKDAFATLKDGATVAFGEFDKGLGLTSLLAEGMQAVGKELVKIGPQLKEIGLNLRDFFTDAAIKAKSFAQEFVLTTAMSEGADASEETAQALKDVMNAEDLALISASLDSAARHAQARRIQDDYDDRKKAIAVLTESEIKAEKAYRAELDALAGAIENTAVKQAALNVEIAAGVDHQREGKQAAADFTVEAEAQLKVTQKIAEAIRASTPYTEAQVKSMRAAAEAEAAQTIALTHQTTAIENQYKAQDALTQAQDANAKAIAEAAIDSRALVIELTKGAAVAAEFTATQKAELEVREKVAAQVKAGIVISDEYINTQLRATEAAHDAAAAVKSQTEAVAKLTQLTASALTPQQAAQKEIDDLTRAYNSLTEAERDALSPATIEAYQKKLATLKDKTSDTFEPMRASLDAFASDFTNFLTEGTFNFKNFAESLIKDVAKIIIEFEILKFIKTAFPGLMGAAQGAAFQGGTVVPFASGGVVASPVTFGLSGGRSGIMGEAGPEAVMPLQRMPGGDLGVKGAAPNISVINQTGVNARARIQSSNDRTSIVLEAATLGAQMAEDRMTRSMRQGYGPTATAMQGTYQLRRRGG